MAKITPEDLLDAWRQMTGEQIFEFNRISKDALSAEQYTEVQKMFYLKLTPKQRWDFDCWITDQNRTTEEKTVIQAITFSDGSTAVRSTVHKNGYGKDI